MTGSFQPFHLGDLRAVRVALDAAERVLVLLETAGAARRADLSPFTDAERREMILGSLGLQAQARLTLRVLPDLSDPGAWVAAVEQPSDNAFPSDPAAIAFVVTGEADQGSGLDRAVPSGWSRIQTREVARPSGDEVRQAYFQHDPAAVDAYLQDQAGRDLPAFVRDWLVAFRARADYGRMVEELAWARKYREAWSSAPYPPVFVTADAVVLWRDQVLLIERKSPPGRGLWALPGGFVEQDERISDAAVRELAEETGLAVDGDELRGALRASRVFDAPRRDMRGRVITHAHLFELPQDQPSPPPATAADDAADLRWVPLRELRREEMFGDHYDIIGALTGDEAFTPTRTRE